MIYIYNLFSVRIYLYTYDSLVIPVRNSNVLCSTCRMVKVFKKLWSPGCSKVLPTAINPKKEGASPPFLSLNSTISINLEGNNKFSVKLNRNHSFLSWILYLSFKSIVCTSHLRRLNIYFKYLSFSQKTKKIVEKVDEGK